MSNAVKIDEGPEALIIRFTDPKRRNPLSADVLAELIDIVARPRAVPKLIFTGSAGVFASGANLREIAELSRGQAAQFARLGQGLMNAIAGSPAATFAAIEGPCFGGGLDLALACDKRIASPGASFSHPGAGLGIITGWGGTQRLPRLVGQGAALELIFTAAAVDSREALRIGLIDQIAEDPLDAALAFKS